MSFSSSTTGLSASPSVTPLIDVLLVLLIIFMVLVPVQSKGLGSVVPQVRGSAAKQEFTSLILHVESSAAKPGTVVYRLQGRTVDAAGLSDALRRVHDGSADEAVWIGGEATVDYHAVVFAMAAARQAGFRETGLLPRVVQESR